MGGCLFLLARRKDEWMTSLIVEYRGFDYSQALNEMGAGQQLLFIGVLFCILRAGLLCLEETLGLNFEFFLVCFLWLFSTLYPIQSVQHCEDAQVRRSPRYD